ncbi:MAG: hypothetical protein AAFN10_28720 [Bacteroidota bacterium]
MKKINILYLAIIPIAIILFQMTAKLGQNAALFYGFAENKETELSHYKAVLIENIEVTPGEYVKEGQLLMTVEQANLDFKIDNAALEVQKLAAEAKRDRQELLAEIAQLKAERSAKQANINAEIQRLEAQISTQKTLIAGLKSLSIDNQSPTESELKLEILKTELAQVSIPIDAELAQLEKMLNAIELPSLAEQSRVKRELNHYETEQSKLNILAPTDGLIGHIRCKEGEHVSAFTKLINFYEPNPTLVKGFVHESLIPQINAGDSLIVSSSLHPQLQITGIVIGLGARIVEIPARLRKMPDIKSYGREVLIQIPSDNPLLQKEKVRINSLKETPQNSLAYIMTLFRPNTPRRKKHWL